MLHSSTTLGSPGCALPVRWLVALLLAATVLGAGLRLYKLETGSVWIDELFTVRTLHDTTQGNWLWTKALGYLPTLVVVELAGVDVSELDPADPSGWRAAGINERLIRLPTAFIGIISVPIVALASRRLLGDRGAVMLAFLLAVAPWHIYWSQAARFYVIQFLFYNLALLFYFTATRPLSRQRLIVALTVSVLAFVSQPTSVVLGTVFAADWLISALRRDPNGPVRLGAFGWAAAVGAIAVCGLLVLADTLAADGRYLGPALYDWPLQQTPKGLVLASVYLVGPALVAFAGFTGLWLWRENPRLAVYLGAAALIPIALYATVAGFYPAGSRYSFICTLAWLALAVIGLDKLWTLIRPRLGLALAAAPFATLVISSLVTVAIGYNSHGNLHARWRDAVRAVESRRQAGEPVYSGMTQITSFYLEEPALPLPKSAEEAAAIDRIAWFVVDNNTRSRTSRFWLLPDAELVDYFSLRAAHTDSSVQVYRHTPRPPSADAPAPAESPTPISPPPPSDGVSEPE